MVHIHLCSKIPILTQGNVVRIEITVDGIVSCNLIFKEFFNALARQLFQYQRILHGGVGCENHQRTASGHQHKGFHDYLPPAGIRIEGLGLFLS